VGTIPCVDADEDTVLLRRWRDGDRLSGDRLFQRHFHGVFRFFRNKTDESAAEELTQSTFLAVLNAAERFAGRSSFRTYVFSIARNQLLMHLRKRYSHGKVMDFGSISVAELGVSPSEVLVGRQEQRLLLRALRHVPIAMQIVVELYYWEGLSTAEVAEVLEVAPGTVRSRLARARERISEEIERLAGDAAVAQSTVEGFETWARKLRDANT